MTTPTPDAAAVLADRLELLLKLCQAPAAVVTIDTTHDSFHALIRETVTALRAAPPAGPAVDALLRPLRMSAGMDGDLERDENGSVLDYSEVLAALAGHVPQVAVPTTCEGCPHLKTERWRDALDNDETDSGTSADCAKAGRNITAYWSRGDSPPPWCPLAPTPQEPTR